MNKLITILCALLLAASVRADTIKDLVRIQGEQENVIFGLGLVG